MRSICISYIGGRVGSSLTMSLLHHSGVDCGNDLRLPDAFNPSGYYESDDVYEIQYNTYSWMQDFMPEYKPFEMDSWAIERKKDAIFKCYSEDLIAVKTPYGVPTELVPGELNHIYLTRNFEDQAESLIEVNAMNASKKEWVKWLKKWDKWMRKTYDFDLIIPFSDWLANPVSTYEQLKVLDLPLELGEDRVKEIIKPTQPKYHR